MDLKNRWIVCLLALVILLTGVPQAVAAEAAAPAAQATSQIKNVIYLIPDGGGYGPYDFADMVKQAGGFDGSLYPNKTPTTADSLTMKSYLAGSLTTASYDSSVTDSAAAGTALATGHKTKNGYIGVDPNGKPLANLVEAAQSVGKATGLIATYEWMHATPAAFSAHAMSRDDYKTLYQQIENQGIDVVLGTGYGKVSSYATIQNAIDRGYTVITDKAQLQSVEPGDRLWGNMASSMPYDIELSSTQASIAEMTQAAITALSGDEDGFFLMVEGSKVDAGGHNNNAVVTTSEYLAFDAAFRVAVEFAKGRTDTVVICAPDHDTGGMQLTADMTAEVAAVQQGQDPSTITWTTSGHTGQNGGVWMYVPEGVSVIEGLNSQLGDTPETRANYVIDNTAIAPYVADLLGVDLAQLTDTLFVDVTAIGACVNGKFIFNSGTKYVYANQSVYYRDGQEISMDGEVAVYANGRFYVPARIVEEADWTAKNENLDGIAGSGTKYDPYIIADDYDFVEFTQNVLSGNTYSGAYFKQTADIDLAENPIYTGMGQSCTFAGIYDGNGHSIHARITTSTDECIFPYVSGTIMNLGTTGTLQSTGTYAGGIARSLRSGGKLINCYSQMSLNGPNVAGLVWSNYSSIVNCYFGGTVSGTNLYPVAQPASGGTFINDYYVDTCGATQSKTGIASVDSGAAVRTLAESLNSGLASAIEAAGEHCRYMCDWMHDGISLPTQVDGPAQTSVFEQISLSLGEDLSLKYYIADDGYTNPQMRFTIHDSTVTVSGHKDGGQYVFLFDGVAPQWIGDTILAELLVEDVVVEAKAYTVLTYLQALQGKTADELGYSDAKYAALQTLISDLLVYGGAAQVYTDHHTDALVSAGVTGTTFEPLTASDAAVMNGAYVAFTGATVYFDSVNRLKFRVTAENLVGISFTVAVNGGAEVAIPYTDNLDGTYTITTDAVYAIGFDDVYVITAYTVDGEVDAKIRYSVRSYVMSMQSKPGQIAELVKATYNYGLAAKVYGNAQ